MKIIDAYWEKRNLGIDVTEVVCSEEDTGIELRNVLGDISTQYSVLKIPSGNMDLLGAAQDSGYKVVEMSIELCGDTHKIVVPDFYNRFVSRARFEQADGRILEKILHEIKCGEIFTTDRIALDHHFSNQIAGARYYNWCTDLLEKGSHINVVYYDDLPVAFSLNCIDKEISNVCDSVFGGVLPAAAKKGLGFFVVFSELEFCKKYNARYSVGRVSSNNLAIFRLHMQFGYEVKNMYYVLTQYKE